MLYSSSLSLHGKVIIMLCLASEIIKVEIGKDLEIVQTQKCANFRLKT